MAYYVAYGSNLNVRQMQMRCPGAKIVGTSVIEGYTLLFKGSKTGSYLTIEKEEEGRVPVGIWSVTKYDEAMLDRYEGYPTFYYKKQLILPINGIEIECFVYIMHEDRPLGIPSERYVQTCLEGYRDFGFDEEILYEAIRRSGSHFS